MRLNFTFLFIAFFIISLSSSCERPLDQKHDPAKKGAEFENKSEDTIKTTSLEKELHIFIENTGSMYGYMNGQTQFKDILTSLLVDLENYVDFDEEKIKISFVNKAPKLQTNPFKSDLQDFPGELSRENLIGIGDSNWSPLSEVFQKVIDTTGSNTISILIMDAIISVGNKDGGGTKELLHREKDKIRREFLEVAQNNQDLVTNIYQFSSDFDGIYYDYYNESHNLNTTRPFYLFILGEEQPIKAFNNTLQPKITSYDGFKNSYTISEQIFDNQYYSVLTATLNNGNFKALRSNIQGNQITGIINSGTERTNGSFQIALALDLNNIPVSEEYLLQPENYVVNSEGFQISRIGKIDGSSIVFPNEKTSFKPSDVKRIVSSTHVIVFESTKTAVSDLSFSLIKNIPNWVSNSTSLDDTNIRTDNSQHHKTFGFSYVVEGIAEAYNSASNDNKYFTIKVPIKNDVGSSGWGLVLGILFGIVIVGLIAFIIIKNKRI